MPKSKATAAGRAKTVRERAQAITADQRYDIDTRDAILNSLQDDASNLAELVRHAERGGIVLDLTGPAADGQQTAAEELAGHIAAVLAHPQTPVAIYNALTEGVCEVYNAAAERGKVDQSPAYITALLTTYASLDKEGEN